MASLSTSVRAESLLRLADRIEDADDEHPDLEAFVWLDASQASDSVKDWYPHLLPRCWWGRDPFRQLRWQHADLSALLRNPRDVIRQGSGLQAGYKLSYKWVLVAPIKRKVQFLTKYETFTRAVERVFDATAPDSLKDDSAPRHEHWLMLKMAKAGHADTWQFSRGLWTRRKDQFEIAEGVRSGRSGVRTVPAAPATEFTCVHFPSVFHAMAEHVRRFAVGISEVHQPNPEKPVGHGNTFEKRGRGALLAVYRSFAGAFAAFLPADAGKKDKGRFGRFVQWLNETNRYAGLSKLCQETGEAGAGINRKFFGRAKKMMLNRGEWPHPQNAGTKPVRK
jgi:hypothetical protein